MIKLLSAFVFLLIAAGLAGNVSAEELSPPKIELSTIVTNLDKHDARNEVHLWAYDARSKVHLDIYDRRGAIYVEIGERRQAALLRLRSEAFEKYLEWLDATAILDLDRIIMLEQTVPAIAEYKDATDALNKEREAQFEIIDAERDRRLDAIDAAKDELLARINEVKIK